MKINSVEKYNVVSVRSRYKSEEMESVFDAEIKERKSGEENYDDH